MDREQLKNNIQTVFDDVINTLKEVDEKELNAVPFEGSWTIGQVGEHIILCSKGIPDGRACDAGRLYDEKSAALESIFLNMNEKTKAAPEVTPKHTVHKKDRLVKALETNKTSLLKITAEKDLMQLCMDMEFPYMGYLTRYEWLYFINVHTQRHFRQINNIKKLLS